MIKLTAKKKYQDRVVLDVNIEFKEGCVYALIGSNGSGKSTLLQLIANQIEYVGKVENAPNISSYMPQTPYAFNLSLIKNITLNNNDIKEGEKLIDEIGLTMLKNKKGNKLSGGEKQKMALCRVLLNKAPLLLLDEPTSAMDISSTLIAEKMILDYKKNNDATVIFATHSINQAKRIADYFIFLKEGIIIETGEIENLISPKTIELNNYINKE